jgi:Peptidogalycan biosysnthesis/recognition
MDLMLDRARSNTVRVYSRRELAQCVHWREAFAGERKDHRYYELVEDTIHRDFDYRYFAITDQTGAVCAIQPFFILEQDLLVGLGPRFDRLVAAARRWWPSFMGVRTLMVGCAAGEGHLDESEGFLLHPHAEALAQVIVAHARRLLASLIVLKEFPAKYRPELDCFRKHGFKRVPSLPMTRVNIDYASFEDYMNRALNSAMRTKLRRKFRAAARESSLAATVVDDVTPMIDDIYPLYLNVYNRSKMHFEKLTREYFCRLGRTMPDKVRFFVWRLNGKTVGFAACMLQQPRFYAEYIGLDYNVALELHLYHCAYRDMVSWAIRNGYKEFCSSGLNYDPKLHFRHLLDPIDLYVRHTSWVLNWLLKLLLPWLEPTRRDKTLRGFPNYRELWGT